MNRQLPSATKEIVESHFTDTCFIRTLITDSNCNSSVPTNTVAHAYISACSVNMYNRLAKVTMLP